MKIVLASNDEFGVSALRGLGDDVHGLIHARSTKQSGYASPKKFDVDNVFCLDAGASMECSLGWIDEIQPDLIVCCGWSRIVPPSILSRYPVIGMHPTRLPALRGGAPIVRTILEGIQESAVSFYRMTDEVDVGNVHLAVPMTIDRLETSTTLYRKVQQIVEDHVREACTNAIDNVVVVPISEFLGSPKFPQRRPWDSCIDWRNTAEHVQRFIRACSDPYPVAFGALHGYRMALFLSDGEIVSSMHAKDPGKFTLNNDLFVVECADQALCFYVDDLEGKLPRSGMFINEGVDRQWIEKLHL